MIRIEVSAAELESAIERQDAKWIARATKKTADLKSIPNKKIQSIWSPIKRVFMDLQHSKCIFCEKEIEDQAIEQDVEHFRPKRNVKRWNCPPWMRDKEGVTISQPPTGSEPGYRLLAYNFFNYAAACKTCNSTRKRDYFPIAGTPRLNNGEDPYAMAGEQAYLIFPFGDWGDDPEDLIGFMGVSPQAIQVNGFGRKRALVTIELFQLDDANGRSYLIKQRAKNITFLHMALVGADDADQSVSAIARRTVEMMTSSSGEHTSCMRSFKRTFEENRAEADLIAEHAFALWESSST